MIVPCLVTPLLLLTMAAPEKEQEKRKGPEDIVVVTATRLEQPVSESISLVSVIPSEVLERPSALVLDDYLRRIPGFSLFRRSSSLVAHPTTQGVSLRGIGPSGTSRTLVLFDGIPWNDPFGGWVYWNRIPLRALEAVEVVRGATSQLYGSSALGGTIQLIPRRPSPKTLEMRGQVGNHISYDLDLFASDSSGDWGYLLAGRVFDTDGFFQIDESLRGGVDIPASSEFQTFFGRAVYKDFHAGVNLFREKRGNGTRLQRNDSRLALFEMGLKHSNWKWSFYSQSGLLNNTFTRVIPDRSTEFVTARQSFPSLGHGSSVAYRATPGLLLGADWRQVSWDELRQNLFGIFAQELFPIEPRLDLLLGIRLDWWQNRQTQAGVNPRLGFLFRGAEWVTMRASAYRGFRAPTLNELYRPFRVGNIFTEANPDLDEERLFGAELGADIHPAGWLLIRLNGFRNSLRDPVSNVTLSVSPDLILRQRQNLGRATINGIETEMILRIGDRWRISAAHISLDATVQSTGLRVAQVPRHQGSVSFDYLGPFRVSAEGRWVGDQFEDDRNQLSLGRYFLVNLMLVRPLSDRLDLFLAAENLFNREYMVRRTPIPSLGIPLLVRAGIHFRLAR